MHETLLMGAILVSPKMQEAFRISFLTKFYGFCDNSKRIGFQTTTRIDKLCASTIDNRINNKMDNICTLNMKDHGWELMEN